MLDFGGTDRQEKSKQKFSFQLDIDLHDDIRTISFREHVSMSRVINAIVRDYMEREGPGISGN